MKEKKKSDLSLLLDFAGSYKGLTFLGLGLSAVAMILGMLPYICIWLVARDLISPLRVAGICIFVCGNPRLFRSADVYASGGIPYSKQYP